MKKSYHDQETELVRSGMEQRGLWLYTFLQEAEAQGLDYEEYGRKVLFDCGCKKAEMSFTDTDSLKEFAKQYVPKIAQKAFDAEIITNTEEKLVIRNTYCPLLEMWYKLTQDNERIITVCDIAMEGDRGILSRFPQFEFKLLNTLAEGDDYCRVQITKKPEE